MNLRALGHWKGALMIAVAGVTPFGAWATGEATLKAAILLGIAASGTAAINWIDSSLQEARARREGKTEKKKVVKKEEPE